MNELSLSLEPLRDHGPRNSLAPAEHETVGRLEIVANRHCATKGMDLHHRKIEQGPLVSGYPIAEWLVWNWWRLRWEPPMPRSAHYRPNDSWFMSHALNTIGSGYCWPDITISSDGFSTELTSRAGNDTTHATFLYFGPERSEVVSASTFEKAVDDFVMAVLERLDDAGLPADNLGAVWEELSEERADAANAKFRRMEARIGSDPDEREEEEIMNLLARAATLGEEAFEELASDPFVQTKGNGMLLEEQHIEETAARLGFDANPSDAVRLREHGDGVPWGRERAWKVGERAASALRAQEGLGLEPVTNRRLCELGAVTEAALEPDDTPKGAVAFMLDVMQRGAKVVLRSANEMGRRFELARLIGDRALIDDGRLFPATATSSYRQKVQRAFAAELLCPWDAVRPMLEEVVSEDDATDIAHHFDVSPLLVVNRIGDHLQWTPQGEGSPTPGAETGATHSAPRW